MKLFHFECCLIEESPHKPNALHSKYHTELIKIPKLDKIKVQDSILILHITAQNNLSYLSLNEILFVPKD